MIATSKEQQMSFYKAKEEMNSLKQVKKRELYLN